MTNSGKFVQLTVAGREPRGMTRRRAMQWVLAAVAASALRPTFGADAATTAPATLKPAEGFGSDPLLLKTYKPGDLWPLTLTSPQHATAIVLADVILPKDEYGAAASELGVVDMLDEWISAPYETQRGDRHPVIATLDWIESESSKRFNLSFEHLTQERQYAICDDICFHETAKPEFRAAADGFRRFRSICAAAYYSTPQGWKAIGYVGNVALESFDGPPDEVLKKLGLTQTVV